MENTALNEIVKNWAKRAGIWDVYYSNIIKKYQLRWLWFPLGNVSKEHVKSSDWEANSNTPTIPGTLFTTIYKSTETFAHMIFTFT